MKRHYVPDVLIEYVDGTIVLEEIKPKRIAERDERTKAKLAAGEKYAPTRGWIFRAYLREK